MAASMSRRDATACFERCYKKLMVFVFKEEDGTRASLNLLLDELIALDCNSLGTNNEMGNSLLKKLCQLVPLKHERLVAKICHVIHNFIRYKLVQRLNGDTSSVLTEFLIGALRAGAAWAMADILRAAAVVMEDHWEPFLQHEDFLVGQPGILVHILNSPSPDVGTIGEATHCLRCLAVRTTEKEGLSPANAAVCFTVLVNMLHSVPSLQLLSSLQCRIIVEALQGVHSLVVNAKVEVEPHLGQLLAAIKGYMFHGLGQPVGIPPELFPTITSGYSTKSPPETTTSKSPRANQSTPTSTKSKNKKSRKKKADVNGEVSSVNDASECTEQTDKRAEGESVSGPDSASQISWARWTSSDSEFSDTDAGQGVKSHIHSTRVRVAAFTCLSGVCKMVDKRSMFGYWPFFIPDSAAASNSPQVQSLFTSILKDPSPKCRVGALISLTAMLDGTKQFLAAAEESSQARTSFTPLSNVLGAMVRELHRSLLQALVVENYNLTLTQLIKCLATLVVNVPYHRMQPGLLSRVAKQLRHFLSHKGWCVSTLMIPFVLHHISQALHRRVFPDGCLKAYAKSQCADSNVRVACLTCLGAMASHQPPLLEVFHIVQSSTPPVGMTKGLGAAPGAAVIDSGVDTCSTSSPASSNDASNSHAVTLTSVGSSEAGTPTLGTSPGIQTPVFTDQMLQAQAQGTSWLIKLCMRNILPQPPPSSGSCGGRGEEGDGGGGGPSLEPLPVRLESLQVLAALCKGYFPVIRGQLKLMQGLIQTCLGDADPTIKLHGCKVLEELGTVMTKDIQETNSSTSASPQTLNIQQALQLWQSVLEGPLLEILQQANSSNPVRASACDCLANIGPDIFTLLQTEEQQQCLRLVLHLTECSDRLVVSAAVRTLGVFVLYPCLSHDVTFVADAANAILKCLTVPSINVKIKAAWSLGNLCDALVVNKDKENLPFIDQFSDLLLSTMLSAAATATQDSDKVKCNAVRAVGNILRYLPTRSLGKSHTVEAVANSVKVIIKTMNSGPMKVRWNSCYAIANMLRNSLLLIGDPPWLEAVLSALSMVVRDCKNFKVRINAALALSIPTQRRHYGQTTIFVMVWESLVQSLRTAEDITDFAEFRYRDSLTEQVCLAVLHMLALSDASDVIALLPALQTVGPVLKEHMHRYLAIRAVKKASVPGLKDVQQRLSTLASGAEITEDLATGVTLLREVCLQDSEEEELETPHPSATSFRQIYD